MRIGQANVKKWVKQIMPLLVNADPLGVDDFASHRLPLSRRPTPTTSSSAKPKAPSR